MQMVTNMVHLPTQNIKEEIGNLLLIVSSEFDDEHSLLEI